MSLTHEDLQEIRKVVEETLDPIKGVLQALSNDVKEIYEMIADIQRSPGNESGFKKMNLEKRYLSSIRN